MKDDIAARKAEFAKRVAHEAVEKEVRDVVIDAMMIELTNQQ